MNSRRFRVPILSAAAPLAFCGSLAISNALYADDGGQAAADFTCALAKEKGKSRLAIFPFTDAKDEETADTHKTTTRVMGAVLKCGIDVIDQSKIKQVLEGQAMGESGLVDSETAPEIGKLTGADSLLFGSVDPKSTQIRIVDASSGKVIGAGVIDVGAQADETAKGNSGNVPAVKKIDAAEAAQSTELMQVRQALRRLHNKKPRLFIYAVSTDQELAELASKRPGHSRAVAKLHQGLDGVRKRRVERLRMRVLELRKTNQDFNARIVEMRASAKPD